MSKTQSENAQTSPDCNVLTKKKNGEKHWCGDEPATMFYIPESGQYIYVCNVHIQAVWDQHPDADEIGL